MNTAEKIEKWECTECVQLYKEIGVQKGFTVMDYGCGFGHYSYAVARALEGTGKIYAVDINNKCLNEIRNKCTNYNIMNIDTVKGEKDYKLNFEDNYFDMILYYDIFHGNGNHRFVLLEEAYRTLKNGGILSVLPFHLSNFRDKEGKKKKYSIKRIINEVEEYNFSLFMKNPDKGLHFEKYHSPYYQTKGGITFDELERGTILNFKKDNKCSL